MPLVSFVEVCVLPCWYIPCCSVNLLNAKSKSCAALPCHMCKEELEASARSMHMSESLPTPWPCTVQVVAFPQAPMERLVLQKALPTSLWQERCFGPFHSGFNGAAGCLEGLEGCSEWLRGGAG